MNVRAIKAKGRDAENAVVEYLRLHGFPAERRRLTGVEDCGDIGGCDGLVVECKAEKKLNLAGYLDELEVELANATTRFGKPHKGFVVAKRRGKTNPATWYAVLPLEALIDILKEKA